MKLFTDQLNRKISLQTSPKRIVSLVPSQTELLSYFGLDEQVVGITKFCVHPEEWFRNKIRIGGTKSINLEKVASLQPDLIIANKEENNLADVVELEKIAPVWISDVKNLKDAYEMILSLGEITGNIDKACVLIQRIKSEFSMLRKHIKSKSVIYLIWNDPIMVAASDTFIDAILNELGFKNAAKDFRRYPELSIEDLINLNPELIFLSSEPFPFSTKHVRFFEDILPKSRTILVDGELFSWYGSRLLNIRRLEYLALQD